MRIYTILFILAAAAVVPASSGAGAVWGADCQTLLSEERQFSSACVDDLTKEKEEHSKCKIYHSDAISDREDWETKYNHQLSLHNQAQHHLDQCHSDLQHLKPLHERTEADRSQCVANYKICTEGLLHAHTAFTQCQLDLNQTVANCHSQVDEFDQPLIRDDGDQLESVPVDCESQLSALAMVRNQTEEDRARCVDAHRDCSSSLEEARDQCRSDREALYFTIDQCQLDLNSTQDELLVEKREVSECQNKLLEAQKLNAKCQVSCAELGEAVLANLTKEDEAIAECHQKIAEQEQKLSNCESGMAKEEGGSSVCHQRLKTAEQYLKTCQDDKDILQNRIDALELEIAALKAEAAEQASKQAAEDEERAKRDAEIQKTLNQALKDAEVAEHDLAKKESRLEGAEGMVQVLQTKLDELEQKSETKLANTEEILNEEREEEDKIVAELKDQVAAADQRAIDAESKLDSCMKQLSDPNSRRLRGDPWN